MAKDSDDELDFLTIGFEILGQAVLGMLGEEKRKEALRMIGEVSTKMHCAPNPLWEMLHKGERSK